MPKYIVEIPETSVLSITVEADSPEEARRIAKTLYDEGEADALDLEPFKIPNQDPTPVNWFTEESPY